VVLRMPFHEGRGLHLQRRLRQTFALLLPGGDEEGANLVAGGIEYGARHENLSPRSHKEHEVTRRKAKTFSVFLCASWCPSCLRGSFFFYKFFSLNSHRSLMTQRKHSGVRALHT